MLAWLFCLSLSCKTDACLDSPRRTLRSGRRSLLIHLVWQTVQMTSFSFTLACIWLRCSLRFSDREASIQQFSVWQTTVKRGTNWKSLRPCQHEGRVQDSINWCCVHKKRCMKHVFPQALIPRALTTDSLFRVFLHEDSSIVWLVVALVQA